MDVEVAARVVPIAQLSRWPFESMRSSRIMSARASITQPLEYPGWMTWMKMADPRPRVSAHALYVESRSELHYDVRVILRHMSVQPLGAVVCLPKVNGDMRQIPRSAWSRSLPCASGRRRSPFCPGAPAPGSA